MPYVKAQLELSAARDAVQEAQEVADLTSRCLMPTENDGPYWAEELISRTLSRAYDELDNASQHLEDAESRCFDTSPYNV